MIALVITMYVLLLYLLTYPVVPLYSIINIVFDTIFNIDQEENTNDCVENEDITISNENYNTLNEDNSIINENNNTLNEDNSLINENHDTISEKNINPSQKDFILSEIKKYEFIDNKLSTIFSSLLKDELFSIQKINPLNSITIVYIIIVSIFVIISQFYIHIMILAKQVLSLVSFFVYCFFAHQFMYLLA